MRAFRSICRPQDLALVERLLVRAMRGVDARPGDDDDARQEARIAGCLEAEAALAKGVQPSEQILISYMRRVAIRYLIRRQRERQHECQLCFA